MATPPVLTFDSLDSTNAEARRLAEAGETGPVWVTAVRQTAGRGRRGRSWSSGVGNLTATLLTTTNKPPAQAAQMSFVAALAVGDLAATYAPADAVRLKWPNDVMVKGLKLAGVLIESGSAADGLWLAIGIGMNLATAPTDVERPAAALGDFMERSPPSPAEAVEVLGAAFEPWLALWETQGFAPIRLAWTSRAQGLGERCTVRLERETLEGVAEGLDASGALVLRLADGTARAVSAGDVFFGAP